MARACTAGLPDPLPRQAYRAVLAWLDSGQAERAASVTGQPVFAHGDPNLANHLWDGNSVHLVDFEASGRGDRATELADFVEHVTVWAHAGINAEAFLDRFDLRPGELQQITQLRPLFAAFWVMRLLPGGSAHHRNPPGTFERQASRLLDLLGPPGVAVHDRGAQCWPGHAESRQDRGH
jgi:thiamine kinase-like enzyme